MSEKETKTETKTETPVTTSKTSSWFSKVWSAIVGAAVGVAAMFGITNDQIATEKAKVQTVKNQVTVALKALQEGDVTTATANLQVAVATGKEIVADAKVIAEKVKEADKTSTVETIKNEITKAGVKDQVKKVEQAKAAYVEETKAATETKTEVKPVTTEVKTEKATKTKTKTTKKTSKKK